MRKPNTFASVTVLTTLVSLSGAVNAQTETDSELLEEIVVTAQKRAQAITDVPVAMNLIGGDLLDQEQANFIDALPRLATSLSLSDDNLGMRGIGTSGFSVQVEPSVAFAIDGVVMARTEQTAINLMDIERVEVLRGPQGTLFGRNASAGLVNVITRAPSDQPEAMAEYQVNADGGYVAKASVGGALSDSVTGRLSGYYENLPGFTHNPAVGKDKNGVDSYNLRGKINVEITDSANLLITGYRQQRQVDGPEVQWRSISDPTLLALVTADGVTPGEENDQASSSGIGKQTRDEYGFQADLTIDLASGAEFRSITATSDWSSSNLDDVDEQSVPLRQPLYVSPLPSPFGTLGPANFQNTINQSIDSVSQEFRLTSAGDEKLNYIVGVYGQQYALADQNRRDFDFCTYPALLGAPVPITPPMIAPGSVCLDPNNDVVSLSTASYDPSVPIMGTTPALTVTELARNIEGLNLAAFGQMDYAITESTVVTAGLRYQYDETDIGFDIVQPNPVPGFGFGMPIGGPVNDQIDGSGLSGKLSIQTDISDDWMAYASYARGYKGPTAEVRSVAAQLGGSQAVVKIDPETSNNYELGTKWALPEQRGFVALTAFLSDYYDFQAEQFSAADQTFILANVGEVQTKGLELETQWKIASDWRIDASVSYVKARIEDYPNARCFVPEASDPDCTSTPPYSKNLAGGVMPNAPELKAYLRGRYDHQFDNGARGFAQLSYSWQDEVQFSLDQNPNTIQDAYGLLNGRVGFTSTGGHLSMSLYGKNLLDQSFTTNIYQDFVTAYSANTLHYIPREARREVGLTLRLNY